MSLNIDINHKVRLHSDKTNLVFDINACSSFLIQTTHNNILSNFYINNYGNVGINTVSPMTKLHILGTDDACIRMQYGDSLYITDIFITNTGDLSLKSHQIGSKVKSLSSFDIVNHDGVNNGLYLNGNLVKATSDNINTLTVPTYGIAYSNKALILNSLKNISSINNLSATSLTGTVITPIQQNITKLGILSDLTVSGLTILNSINMSGILQISNTSDATNLFSGSIQTAGGISSNKNIYAGNTVISTNPIAETSGGTGRNSYSIGDVLYANSSSTLNVVSLPQNTGKILSYTPNGPAWMYEYIIESYIVFSSVTIMSNNNYIFGKFFGRNSTNTLDIIINSTYNVINLNNIGVNGLDSIKLASTVYYAYAIANAASTLSGYIFSNNPNTPILPIGYTQYAHCPFYCTTNELNIFIGISKSGPTNSLRGINFYFLNPINIITGANNEASNILNTSLIPLVPNTTTRLFLLITFIHPKKNSLAITIGHNNTNFINTILNTDEVSAQHLQITVPIIQMSIDTYFNNIPNGSTYSISLLGFMT